MDHRPKHKSQNHMLLRENISKYFGHLEADKYFLGHRIQYPQKKDKLGFIKIKIKLS